MSLRAKGSLWLAAVLVGALLLGASAGAFAQQCAAPAARVVSIQGSLELRPHKSEQWQAAQTGIPICSGDSVRVGPRSRAALLLPNETTLRLDQGTTLTLSAPDQAQASLLDLILGTIHVISRTPKPFRVNTPYLNAGVEGTEFLVGSSETSARLAVFEGRVSATTADSSLMLVGGEIAYAAKGVPLRKERMLRPADAVQWALYYPTLFDHRLGELIAGTPGEAALRESIALYRQDRLAEAIFRLDKAPEGLANARFLTYRAGLLLLVGRADEAGSDIERVLAVDVANSTAHALKSVVALTQNDKDQALKLAAQAVELDQASPVARLAFSYAQQAHFKIEEALASVQKAVDLDPQNALAWARLAELHMSTGYLDRALEAAKRAANLNPEVAKTQSVLGFANLTRIDTQAAKQAFQKAIDLDQADPLPRLGLGLAMIREGELTAGREQLEIAVCLDPENSLLRSYVGKAYYEEKRDKLAGIQFELAKERDPRDPTPWFYDAIRKQTENRPVESLQDLQQSIELNYSRSVYRSRLLLDQDQAARGASLARTYDSLGFAQLALEEAAKSLNLNPTSHSGHRFLSDAYANIRRHEIARVSELLQAQLLQPINVNPVQPRLSVTDLNAPSIAGSSTCTFNEFSPLFERNKPQLIASTIAGNRGTWGEEIVLSGLQDRVSYSLGQFKYRTDGIRQNNSLRHDIYNAFVQFAATPSLNFQTEVRRRNTEHGDLNLHFNESSFSLADRRTLDQDTLRIGLHYTSSPNSDWILSLIRSNGREDQTTAQGGVEVTDAVVNRGNQVEGQYLFRGGLINLIVGFGNYRINSDQKETADLSALLGISCPPDEICETRERRIRSQESAYAYANIALTRGVTANIGVSRVEYGDGIRRLKRWDPKLGIRWEATPRLTFRVAAFDALKRALAANQTLEPTQVVGFNQFFDDANGTRARSYGFAVDAILGERAHVGLYGLTRRLAFPIGNTYEDQRENSYVANLYWTPFPRWAASAELHAETFQRAEAVANDPRPIQYWTIRAPVSVRYFHPSGVFWSVTSTYVGQSIDRVSSDFGSGRDRFALTVSAL